MSQTIANDIFQYSLYSVYLAGLKDGGPPAAFLSKHSNHGIGCFEKHESDMIEVDGIAYSIDKYGDVTLAGKDDQLPFAMVTIFQPTQWAKPPPGTTSKTLREMFGTALFTPITFRIRGPFKYVNTQQQTYRIVQGTIFGFFVPGWQVGVSGESLQCCFLRNDAAAGGRVVAFETDHGGTFEWAKCGRLHLGFPQDDELEELELRLRRVWLFPTTS